MARFISAIVCTTLHSGSDLTKNLPYPFESILESSTATTPLSSLPRISLPKPCLKPARRRHLEGVKGILSPLLERSILAWTGACPVRRREAHHYHSAQQVARQIDPRQKECVPIRTASPLSNSARAPPRRDTHPARIGMIDERQKALAHALEHPVRGKQHEAVAVEVPDNLRGQPRGIARERFPVGTALLRLRQHGLFPVVERRLEKKRPAGIAAKAPAIYEKSPFTASVAETYTTLSYEPDTSRPSPRRRRPAVPSPLRRPGVHHRPAPASIPSPGPRGLSPP